jgi:murein DD-endopeptidase MepM/ murein hydrolase activator NlpD
VFAGVVAGRTWVTVLHPDGLRSSYGPLATVGVAAGDVVDRGDVLGATGATFHLGVRRGDIYIDPAGLFRVRRRHARLVPVPPRPKPPRNVVRDYRQTASLATRLAADPETWCVTIGKPQASRRVWLA